jgi:hypothetical protein
MLSFRSETRSQFHGSNLPLGCRYILERRLTDQDEL